MDLLFIIIIMIIIVCLKAEPIQTSHQIPLFLRFLNMIVNDATLQLDEGLQVCIIKNV